MDPPGAADRGVTAERIAALTAAITAFSGVMNTPRGEIVNRSAILREVETDVAGLVELVTDMDDLVLQFDGSDDAERFIEAWKRARMIVDVGGSPGTGSPQPTSAPAAATAAAAAKLISPATRNPGRPFPHCGEGCFFTQKKLDMPW